MFSNHVRTLLEASGWSHDRRVSTDHWTAQLAAEGFAIIPRAVEVLASFGGLTITPTKVATSVYAPEVLRFDPVLGASGEADRIQYWENWLETRLTPIGETGGGAIMLLAEDGKLYSCWDRIMWLDGNTFEDAMEHTLILADRKPMKIGEMGDTSPSVDEGAH